MYVYSAGKYVRAASLNVDTGYIYIYICTYIWRGSSLPCFQAFEKEDLGVKGGSHESKAFSEAGNTVEGTLKAKQRKKKSQVCISSPKLKVKQYEKTQMTHCHNLF